MNVQEQLQKEFHQRKLNDENHNLIDTRTDSKFNLNCNAKVSTMESPLSKSQMPTTSMALSSKKTKSFRSPLMKRDHNMIVLTDHQQSKSKEKMGQSNQRPSSSVSSGDTATSNKKVKNPNQNHNQSSSSSSPPLTTTTASTNYNYSPSRFVFQSPSPRNTSTSSSACTDAGTNGHSQTETEDSTSLYNSSPSSSSSSSSSSLNSLSMSPSLEGETSSQDVIHHEALSSMNDDNRDHSNEECGQYDSIDSKIDYINDTVLYTIQEDDSITSTPSLMSQDEENNPNLSNIATAKDASTKTSISPQAKNKTSSNGNTNGDTNTPNKSSNPMSFFIQINNDNNQDQDQSSANAPKLPVLQLGNFQESVWLDYGDDRCNVVGKSRSLSFVLQAPPPSSASSLSSPDSNKYNKRSSLIDDEYHILEIEKVPVKKGFSLSRQQEHGHQQEKCIDNNLPQPQKKSSITKPFYIKDGEKEIMTLTWTPISAGGIRETIYLKMQRGRIRIIAYGKARNATPVVVKRKKKLISVRNGDKTSQMVKNNTTVSNHDNISKKLGKGSISKGLHVKSNKVASPINKTEKQLQPWMVYDDAFADKQCEAYTIWLNYIIKAQEEIFGDYKGQQHKQQAEIDESNQIENPTLRSLLIERRRMQASQRAIHFFNSPEMKSIRKVLKMEIVSKRLSIRSDHDVLANVNLRSQMISLLLSYSTPWLKLGLETIFGVPISLNMATKSIEKTLKIRKSLGIVSSKSKMPTMKSALKQFVIERVLSDEEVLKKYTHGKCKMPSGKFETMYKEELGQVTLHRILLLVVFLDMAKINNLIESSPRLFHKNAKIKSSKEFLAILCRDYLHGIGSVFKHLGQVGVSVSYEQTCIDELDFTISNLATDLRDGVILGKLSECLSGSHEQSILATMRLPAVSRLQKVHNVQIALSSLTLLDIAGVEKVHPNHIVDGHRPQVLKMIWNIASTFKLPSILDVNKLRKEIHAILRSNRWKINGKSVSSTEISNIDSCDDVCELLLRWCQAICSRYNHDVKNFSSSFTDGKALCMLIHHYHPSMISKEIILFHTADDNVNQMSQGQGASVIHNGKENFNLALEKMIDIGGIPHGMLLGADSTDTPDSRSMIICVSYLCARLLESSYEIHAAIAIQRLFRTSAKKENIHNERNAVLLIESYWMRNKSTFMRNRLSQHGMFIREDEECIQSVQAEHYPTSHGEALHESINTKVQQGQSFSTTDGVQSMSESEEAIIASKPQSRDGKDELQEKIENRVNSNSNQYEPREVSVKSIYFNESLEASSPSTAEEKKIHLTEDPSEGKDDDGNGSEQKSENGNERPESSDNSHNDDNSIDVEGNESHRDERSYSMSFKDEQNPREKIQVPVEGNVKSDNFIALDANLRTTVHDPNAFCFQVEQKSMKQDKIEIAKKETDGATERTIAPKQKRSQTTQVQSRPDSGQSPAAVNTRSKENAYTVRFSKEDFQNKVSQLHEGKENSAKLQLQKNCTEDKKFDIGDTRPTDIPLKTRNSAKVKEHMLSETVMDKVESQLKEESVDYDSNRKKDQRSTTNKQRDQSKLRREEKSNYKQKERIYEEKILEEIAEVRILARQTKQKMERKNSLNFDDKETMVDKELVEREEVVKVRKNTRNQKLRKSNSTHESRDIDHVQHEQTENQDILSELNVIQSEKESNLASTKKKCKGVEKGNLLKKEQCEDFHNKPKSHGTEKLTKTSSSKRSGRDSSRSNHYTPKKTSRSPEKTSSPPSSLKRKKSPTSIVFLDQKTRDALNIVQSSRKLSEVMEAVQTLETTTRLSYESCKALAATDAPLILYKFMHICNRSAPHIELLQQILYTLANVSKMSTLISGIITDNCVEVLLDVLQLFRDKETIFSFSATLLWRIVFTSDQMTAKCRRRENFKRIKGVYALTAQEIQRNIKTRKHEKYTKLVQKLGMKALKKLIEKLKSS